MQKRGEAVIFAAVGIEIDRDEFTAEDHRHFAERLQLSLDVLRQVLARPGFGEGPASIGAELELNLMAPTGRAWPANRAVLEALADRCFTTELNAFNLEMNAHPQSLAGCPFSALAAELEDGLARCRKAAATQNTRVVPVGILPTLGEADVGPSAMTDSRRFRALSTALLRLFGPACRVRIEGEETFEFVATDVTFEGANTSFQVHLRVPPGEFADTYNAAQVATAPVLACSSNSPFLLGHRLWRETRIALFRASVDARAETLVEDWRPARVSFGHGWAREGALELFAESVALHPALLPMTSAEDPRDALREDRVPPLHELRLHNGTVWHWNRPIYDPSAGGHLRIELRSLPAGPTVVDMVSNAAFLLGLTLALRPRMKEMLPGLPFGHARRNFYEAARKGLDAQLLWPPRTGALPVLRPANELARELIPLATEGLVSAGVVEEEAARWLEVIGSRIEARTTGADWQRRFVDRLGDLERAEALARMTLRYADLAESGRPVHEWGEAP